MVPPLGLAIKLAVHKHICKGRRTQSVCNGSKFLWHLLLNTWHILCLCHSECTKHSMQPFVIHRPMVVCPKWKQTANFWLAKIHRIRAKLPFKIYELCHHCRSTMRRLSFAPKGTFYNLHINKWTSQLKLAQRTSLVQHAKLDPIVSKVHRAIQERAHH